MLSLIDVVLEGGPTSLTPAQRICRIRADEWKVKLPHWGGYEHFERVEGPAADGEAPVVFRWTGRTRIAE